ncbi:MAG: hypothetical protein ACRDAM_15860 [Casimicrobium sp.]
MSTSITHTEHRLEISHRNQAWVPVDTSACAMPWLKAAAMMARQNQIDAALLEAEEAWIAKHEHMHGTAFRVVTKTETFHSLGNYERCMKTPGELEEQKNEMRIKPNPNVNPPAPPYSQQPRPAAPPPPPSTPF